MKSMETSTALAGVSKTNTYKTSKPTSEVKKTYNYCHKTGHSAENCFKKRISGQRYKKCHYCKKKHIYLYLN